MSAQPTSGRPRRDRQGARVVIVTPDERVLLTERFDPGLPESGWWTTPGGGVDPGESDREAAARELWEETGQRVAAEQLVGPVARRTALHGYTDQITRQSETFFVWTVDAAFDVEPQVVTERERISTRGSRWWPLGELAATTAWVWDPAPAVLDALARPELWPLELGDIELSTVPVEG